MRRIALFLFCLPLLVPTAFAQTTPWSLSLGLGSTRFAANEAGIEREFPGLLPGFEVRESATAFRLGGSYEFDPYLALDLDLIQVGDLIAADADGRHKLFSVTGAVTAIRARRPFGESVTGFVRLGAFLWSSSVNIDDTVDDGLDLAYGLGLDVNVYGGRERLLRLLWERYGFNGVTLDRADVVSLNLVFNF